MTAPNMLAYSSNNVNNQSRLETPWLTLAPTKAVQDVWQTSSGFIHIRCIKDNVKGSMDNECLSNVMVSKLSNSSENHGQTRQTGQLELIKASVRQFIVKVVLARRRREMKWRWRERDTRQSCTWYFRPFGATWWSWLDDTPFSLPSHQRRTILSSTDC